MNGYKTLTEIQNFFKSQGLIYTHSNIIRYEPLKGMDLAKSSYYLENFQEFSRLNRLYGKQIHQHYIPPVELKLISSKLGYGLFALENIPRNSFIGEYTGEVKVAQDTTVYHKNDDGYLTDYAWDYPDEIPNHPLLEIDGRVYGNILRYLNHSFSPNVQSDHTMFENEWRLIFWACEEIKKGQQLLTNYGEEYWSTDARELIPDID